LYPCFMEHILGCTLVTHPGKLKWLQWCILWSSKCRTSWETRT
jgi:hypothetical protein